MTRPAHDSLPPLLRRAIEAAQDKKAAALTVLDLTGLGAFTEYFLLCTGTSARHVQAICDEMEERLARDGARRALVEGYHNAEWVLLDYGSAVLHVFNERARLFYDLERLWRAAPRFDVPDLAIPHSEAGR